jgi:hypothetical protein
MSDSDKRYGDYGRPVMLFEAYEDWRNEQLALDEADSKADFPSFLFGPVRQSLWHGYERVQPQYKRYARVEAAPDFRERRLRGLAGFTKPGYVGDHGDYPVVARQERASASLVVDTYGAMYSITRQAIINDDSNELLNSAPTEMGDAAAQFVVETVVALIESNPTAPDGTAMYHSSRGNLGTAALSEDALVDGIAALTKQRDDAGRRIRISANTLVVPTPRLQLIANRILNSQMTGTVLSYGSPAAGTGTGVFDKGNMNPLAGILPADAVVYDPYFTDQNDWYLFADPSRVPAFAVGFLNGQEAPQVFLKEPMVSTALGGNGQDPYRFDLDSVDFKVRLDFGVAPVDFRGSYKSVVS